MNRDEFERAVREKVTDGETVSRKGIAGELDVPAEKARAWLDTMYSASELELDLDDDGDFIYRRGKKLVAPAETNMADKITSALVPLGQKAVKEAATKALLGDDEKDAVPPDQRKSLAWGAGLGFLIPGAGLFYAAPFVTAVVATLGVGVLGAVLWLISALPIIGGPVSYAIFGLLMLVSGVLGTVYTYKFNKTGKRTRLSTATDKRRALPF